MALVDTWVTHNFISTSEIAKIISKLGLKLPRDDSKLKGVNSQAHETNGLKKNVAIQMGDWNGMIDFLSDTVWQLRVFRHALWID